VITNVRAADEVELALKVIRGGRKFFELGHATWKYRQRSFSD